MRQSEQQLLKAEVDRHLAEGTTTMAAGEWVNPISEYTADERLQLEGERLFRRLPLVAAHVSDLPDPGSFVSRTLFGVPLLIVHGSDRVIRALVNVCRHRGATVESQPSGCARRFTCPYHAWTFSNDGTLVGIPNAEGFEGLDRHSFGLVELPSATRHGFVWVGLDTEASLDLDDFLGELDPELGSWGLEHSHAVRSTRLEVEANWKLVIDGFLETYHVAFLHSESVAPYIRSNLGVFKEFGRHGRMANVRYRYAGEGQPLDDSFLYGVGGVYVLFPNTVILWHGTHLERYTITPAPGDPGRSVCDIELLAPTETRADMDKWNRNWDLVLGTITGEDFPMAVSAQAGFAAGYPSHFVFGRNEPFVQHFHRQLAAHRRWSDDPRRECGLGETRGPQNDLLDLLEWGSWLRPFRLPPKSGRVTCVSLFGSDNVREAPVTSQDLYASDVGLAVALELANLARSGGGQSELRAVFASDPVSVESVDDAEADQFLELAQQSATIAGLLATNTERDTDHAVEILNQLLEIFPAQLHLTKQELGWTLHHHRRDAPLVPAWSAVVAGAFARVIGYGRQARVGSCQASDCDRYFYDLSKNNSRRYCSLACQNRTKAAAHRARRKG